MTPLVAAELRAGALDPDVAYMRGQLKVSGDMARFYDLLPLARNTGLLSVLGVLKVAE